MTVVPIPELHLVATIGILEIHDLQPFIPFESGLGVGLYVSFGVYVDVGLGVSLYVDVGLSIRRFTFRRRFMLV